MQKIISVFRKIVFGISLWAYAGAELAAHILKTSNIYPELVGAEFPEGTEIHKYGTGAFPRNNRVLKKHDQGMALCSCANDLPTTDCAAGDFFDIPEGPKGVYALIGYKKCVFKSFGDEELPVPLNPVFKKAEEYIKERANLGLVGKQFPAGYTINGYEFREFSGKDAAGEPATGIAVYGENGPISNLKPVDGNLLGYKKYAYPENGGLPIPLDLVYEV